MVKYNALKLLLLRPKLSILPINSIEEINHKKKG